MAQESFDPRTHVAKFYFEQYAMWEEPYLKEIFGNLYTKELTIEIRNFRGNIVDVFGYSLANELNGLLPLLRWVDFEKLRNFDAVSSLHQTGYRDGWGYRFVCMNESGDPMISSFLGGIFEKSYEPADERLLRWIKNRYAKRRELSEYGMLW